MNLQQLKIVKEAIRQNFNLTEVGKVLYISQSGVSKSLKELEDELGVDLFLRTGKRLIGLTPAGQEMIDIINRILLDTHNLQIIADRFADKTKGNLILATTHTQARYALPAHLKKFLLDYPEIHLTLHQGSPQEIRDLLLDGVVDIGIATEELHLSEDLVTFPWYSWHHGILAPDEHPILYREKLTLQDLAEFPLITYHTGFTGRSHFDEAFKIADLEPDIVITALDADVIKSYVELGLGLGVIANTAYIPERDKGLRFIPAFELFGFNTTHIAVKRGHFLRDFAYDFIESLAPQFSRESILKHISENFEKSY